MVVAYTPLFTLLMVIGDVDQARCIERLYFFSFSQETIGIMTVVLSVAGLPQSSVIMSSCCPCPVSLPCPCQAPGVWMASRLSHILIWYEWDILDCVHQVWLFGDSNGHIFARRQHARQSRLVDKEQWHPSFKLAVVLYWRSIHSNSFGNLVLYLHPKFLALQSLSKETQLWIKNFSCPPPHWRRGLSFEEIEYV